MLMAILVLALGTACGGTESTGSFTASGDAIDFVGDNVDFKGVAERVFFVEPSDGADVSSPFKVVMGTQGLIVRRRFEPQKRYGHHHIFVDDTTIPGYEDRLPTPDGTHLHFHSVEKETVLELPQGQHTLTLVFGNAHDYPYEFQGAPDQDHPLAYKVRSAAGAQGLDPVAATITINVVAEKRVYFIEPEDEAQIREFPFTVEVGSVGIEDSGGHYVIVWDAFPLPPEGEPMPVDDNHIHLEPGQTEVALDLRSGGYPFHVVAVDANNMLVGDPPLLDSINIVLWKSAAVESLNEGVGNATFRLSGRGETLEDALERDKARYNDTGRDGGGQ